MFSMVHVISPDLVAFIGDPELPINAMPETLDMAVSTGEVNDGITFELSVLAKSMNQKPYII